MGEMYFAVVIEFATIQLSFMAEIDLRQVVRNDSIGLRNCLNNRRNKLILRGNQ